VQAAATPITIPSVNAPMVRYVLLPNVPAPECGASGAQRVPALPGTPPNLSYIAIATGPAPPCPLSPSPLLPPMLPPAPQVEALLEGLAAAPQAEAVVGAAAPSRGSVALAAALQA
jgi:hypothetical protein